MILLWYKIRKPYIYDKVGLNPIWGFGLIGAGAMSLLCKCIWLSPYAHFLSIGGHKL